MVPGIADWPTRFGVEGGSAIEHDRRVIDVQHPTLDLVVIAPDGTPSGRTSRARRGRARRRTTPPSTLRASLARLRCCCIARGKASLSVVRLRSATISCVTSRGTRTCHARGTRPSPGSVVSPAAVS
jgi:hypothetical protein